MNNEEKILGMLETLTTDMAGMKTDMAGMKTDMAGMKTEMAEVKERLSKVESAIEETKKDVRKLVQSVTVLEHDHKEITGALFDGFTNNTERLTRIEDKVTYYDEVLLRRVSKSVTKKAVK